MSRSEKILFNTLTHFSKDNVLNLSQLNSKFSSETQAEWFLNHVNSWEEAVKNEIDLPEYFDDTGSTLISGISLGGMAFGAILAVLGFMTNLGNGFYCLIAGILLFIFSLALMRFDEDIFGRCTQNGRTFYLKWDNFRKFLEDNSLIEEHPPESIVVWRKYLIYGTALGVAKEVYESMKL